MKKLSTLLLAALLPSAHAQVGQSAGPVLSAPLFQGAQAGPAGLLTLKNGASVVLTQRGGFLTGATVAVAAQAGAEVRAQTTAQTMAGGSAAQVTATAEAPALTGAAQASEVLGVLTGFGEGLSAPLLQFLSQPGVIAALPQGITVDAAPFTITAKLQGRALVLQVALSQVPAGQFATSRNVRPAARPGRTLAVRVYSDFQCPYCQKWELEALPVLLKSLPEDVRVEFHHLPLEQIHPLARPAAEASECAAQQGRFWDYKDTLFRDRTWLQGNPNEAFLKLAGDLKLDPTKFKDCLALRGGKAAVDAGLVEAQKLGLNATPIVFVEGYRAANPFDTAGLLKLVEFARATR